jgi:(p)ppGpp synthase/HD superfamily hydrolase
MQGSEALTRAYELAREAHRGQAGKDGRSPYIRHPLAVAERLAAEGLDEPTLVAAILHDVVEDSDLGIDDVVARFGTEVGQLVSALTDDATIADYEERRAEHRARVAQAGRRAAAIYAADKLVNVRELRNLYGERGEEAGEWLPVSIDDRVALWRADLEMLEPLVGDLVVTAAFRRELDAFEAERRGRRRHAGVA